MKRRLDRSDQSWKRRTRDATSLVLAICKRHEIVVGSVALTPEGDAVFGFHRAEPPWDPPGEHEDVYADETDDYAIGVRGTYAEEILAAEPRRSDELEIDIELSPGVGHVRIECPEHRHDLYFSLEKLRAKTLEARRRSVVTRAFG